MKDRIQRWILPLCVLIAGVDIGGSFYEGALIVPVWTASPPESFALIQPQSGGISLTAFWIPVHGVFTLLLIAALALFWRDRSRRQLILGAFVSYLIMRIWTFAYFIPEIAEFIQMPLDAAPSAELAARADRWGMLSHGRMILVMISAVLLMRAISPADAAD